MNSPIFCCPVCNFSFDVASLTHVRRAIMCRRCLLLFQPQLAESELEEDGAKAVTEPPICSEAVPTAGESMAVAAIVPDEAQVNAEENELSPDEVLRIITLDDEHGEAKEATEANVSAPTTRLPGAAPPMKAVVQAALQAKKSASHGLMRNQAKSSLHWLVVVCAALVLVPAFGLWLSVPDPTRPHPALPVAPIPPVMPAPSSTELPVTSIKQDRTEPSQLSSPTEEIKAVRSETQRDDEEIAREVIEIARKRYLGSLSGDIFIAKLDELRERAQRTPATDSFFEGVYEVAVYSIASFKRESDFIKALANLQNQWQSEGGKRHD